MAERKIAEKSVKTGLKDADKVIFQDKHRFRAVKKVRRLKKNYCIVIVFDQFPNLKEVVTVFYTSKIHKYL